MPIAAAAPATGEAGARLPVLVLGEAFTFQLLAGSALIPGSLGIAAWPGRGR